MNNTLLEVSGVSVSFDGFKAINSLSIQIAEPELRAIIGPNGNVSPGRKSHSDASYHISVVILHTKYHTAHLNDFNVYA